MAELKRIERRSKSKLTSRGHGEARHQHSNPKFLRKAVAMVGLCVFLTGAGFAVAYVGGTSVAYLLGVD